MRRYAEARLTQVWFADSVTIAGPSHPHFAGMVETTEYLGGIADFTGEVGRWAVAAAGRRCALILCMNYDFCRFGLGSMVCVFVVAIVAGVAVRDEAAVRAALATDHACLKAWMALGVGGESPQTSRKLLLPRAKKETEAVVCLDIFNLRTPTHSDLT
jgi:hypothetical protein